MDADWLEEHGLWSRTIPSVAGMPSLALHVFPDRDDEAEPWTWEVLEVEDDFTEYEIDVGGAPSLEAAISAAEAVADARRKSGK